MGQPAQPEPAKELGKISTEWSVISDPVQFVERYALAIHRYLLALLKNRDDADEVGQDFFLWVTKNGFPRAKKERGRFRDYLKVAVRNAALNFLQRRRPLGQGGIDLSQVPDPAEAPSLDREWAEQWRSCLLNRAWAELENHRDRSQQSVFYTVLRLAAKHPNEDSAALAASASAVLGRTIRADAFRKQVSRARRLFARLLVEEIAQSLDKPTPEQIAEELVDLGLMTYVRDFLPASWRVRNQSAG